MTYAVLRHRVFDVRVVIRHGLQYAVARHALLALVPLMAVVLVADLITHRQQTVGQMFGERGWIYVVLGGLAVFAHTQRNKWLAALDRRFFRELYDAQHLLREVLEIVRWAAKLSREATEPASSIGLNVGEGLPFRAESFPCAALCNPLQIRFFLSRP